MGIEMLVVLLFVVCVMIGIIFLMLGDLTKIWGQIHGTNEGMAEKEIHHISLEHELWFYDLCYKEACPEKKRDLKILFKEYIQQHHKSQKANDRAMVWAVRKILRGRFNNEAYKRLRDKLARGETAKHASFYIHHHGQSFF